VKIVVSYYYNVKSNTPPQDVMLKASSQALDIVPKYTVKVAHGRILTG
jgi:hypothetical protein